MIAKIGRSSNLYGALAYNQLKVEKEKAQILFANKLIETQSGQYSTAQLARSFEPYFLANRNTEKTVLHISLNPAPGDKVSDEQFTIMAEEYMREMGYGLQPFAVFKHTDIGRTHIHIVSVCVDEQGKKISDKFEKRRSMNICRELERKYGLLPAAENVQSENAKIFHPVEYHKGDIKSQISSVVRHLPKYYQFETLGQYNALLSLFNIAAEKVESELYGKMHRGLVYMALNENGKKAAHPIKASLLGNDAGMPALELHFARCREPLKYHPAKEIIKSAVNSTMKEANDELNFKKHLASKGINAIIRRNDTGRIYGMTFIDHNSKTVWNGSSLGKEFSANAFNDHWSEITAPEVNKPADLQPKAMQLHDTQELYAESPHPLFHFLTSEKCGDNFIGDLGGLFQNSQGDDYEEQDFENKMKKKRKRRTGR